MILQKLYNEIQCDKLELDVQLSNDWIEPQNGDSCGSYIGLGESGRAVEAEAIFEEMNDNGLKPRTRAYNALLKGYVKAGSLKDAEFIVSETERNGISPDEHTYSLLIDAYGNAGRWERARIVLKEMEASNVMLNSYVFSRILANYPDRGEWQKSFQVLREMKNSGVRPDRHFYNVMIDTFGNFDCLDHAMATFDRMMSEGYILTQLHGIHL
ncbi:hypothetical protein GH714_011155 [Hevea brasiliensis]|uniref:Pentacotripeptide-repeat region of PRORP domain-containing protein n=1 Tax=Hevea brasiliensis TaxID=3981 RepID=A0A6A6L2B1_HEVBR|nr:hypothetical protein GH714_011155 [Hevea brasiliensis]